MSSAETLTIHNEPGETARAAAWLDRAGRRAGLAPRVLGALQVAMEEVLTNIQHYAFSDIELHAIEIRAGFAPAAVTLEFIDDGNPFDPGQAAAQPPDRPATAPGGLGLRLVRELMDEVRFSRDGGRNHLTLRKSIQHAPPEPAAPATPARAVEPERGALFVLAPDGRLDGVTTAEFARLAHAACDAGIAALAIDFAAVDYVTSAAFRVLLRLRKRADGDGIALALCGLHGMVATLFEASGLRPVFTCHPDRAAALVALGGDPA